MEELKEKLLNMIDMIITLIEGKVEFKKVINSVYNNENSIDNFVNMDVEERKKIYVSLGLSLDEIKSFNDSLSVINVKFMGEIGKKINEDAKTNVKKLLLKIREMFSIESINYDNDLVLIKKLNMLKEDLNNNNFTNFETLKDYKLLLENFSLSEKEKLVILRQVVIDHSKQVANLQVNIDDDVEKLEKSIEDIVDIDHSTPEILSVEEPSADQLQSEDNFDEISDNNINLENIASQTEFLDEEDLLVINSAKNHIGEISHNISHRQNLFDSYIELCDEHSTDEKSLKTQLKDIYETNITLVFKEKKDYEDFIRVYIKKQLEDLCDLLNMKVSEADYELKKQLIKDCVSKIKVLQGELQNVDTQVYVDSDEKHKLLFYFSDSGESSCEKIYKNLNSNLQKDIRMALKKLSEDNFGETGQYRISGNLFSVRQNNVYISFAKIEDDFLIIDIIPISNYNNIKISSLKEKAEDIELKKYIHKLLNDKDFYSEILNMSNSISEKIIGKGSAGGYHV